MTNVVTSPDPSDRGGGGKLVPAGEDGFEEAAVGRVFNHRRPGRRPDAVLLAECEQDVVDGVRLARERGWQVAVRSGGHSWAAWSVRDGGLLIDLGGLSELEIDPETFVVRASPNVTGERLAPFLARHDRVFPGGHCPTVGIGGFLLQGGQGWNCRGWGWGAEHVVAVDVVLADGRLVHASEHENPELLWAARGGGPGFFGVVTRFHLRTRPRPQAMRKSVYVYELDQWDVVADWFARVQRRLPPTVEAVMLSTAVPAAGDGHFLLVSGVAFTDTEAEAHEALAPLASCPVVDSARLAAIEVPTSIEEEFVDQHRANPEGHRYRADCAWIGVEPERSVPALRRAFTDMPGPKTFSLWFSMDPLRELPDMAFSRQAEIYFATYVVWEDEADDERHRAWLAARMAEIEPVADGCYLGDSDFTLRPARFMSDTAWARFRALRERYDPGGLFVGYLGEVAHA
jgi:FAD/FMN-containing dehydrogenase